MKYYELKKDLPTFKVGEEFYLNENGNLISVENEPLVAYSKRTLEKFPNILKDWFEEISEVYKRWRAKKGEEYYCWRIEWGVCRRTEHGNSMDNSLYSIGDYFKTEKEAEKYGEYLIALQTIKNDTKGFVPDWGDALQGKYKGFYNHPYQEFDLISVSTFQSLGTIYFKNKEDIQESFKKHRKEWLIVLGVENERN